MVLKGNLGIDMVLNKGFSVPGNASCKIILLTNVCVYSASSPHQSLACWTLASFPYSFMTETNFKKEYTADVSITALNGKILVLSDRIFHIISNNFPAFFLFFKI